MIPGDNYDIRSNDLLCKLCWNNSRKADSSPAQLECFDPYLMIAMTLGAITWCRTQQNLKQQVC